MKIIFNKIQDFIVISQGGIIYCSHDFLIKFILLKIKVF